MCLICDALAHPVRASHVVLLFILNNSLIGQDLKRYRLSERGRRRS